jgi:hypothetical protein
VGPGTSVGAAPVQGHQSHGRAGQGGIGPGAG